MKTAAIASTLLLHAAAIGAVVHLHSGQSTTQSSTLPVTITLVSSPGAATATPAAIMPTAQALDPEPSLTAPIPRPKRAPNNDLAREHLAKTPIMAETPTLTLAAIPIARKSLIDVSADTPANASSGSPSAAITIKTGASIPASYADSNRKPVYPLLSRRQEEQGTVLLQIRVKTDGTAGEIHVKKTSGYPLLDESALNAVQNWRFIPASVNNKPVAEWYQIAIPFKLHN